MTNATSPSSDPQLVIYESDIKRLLENAQESMEQATVDSNPRMENHWRSFQIGLQSLYRIHETNTRG